MKLTPRLIGEKFAQVEEDCCERMAYRFLPPFQAEQAKIIELTMTDIRAQKFCAQALFQSNDAIAILAPNPGAKEFQQGICAALNRDLCSHCPELRRRAAIAQGIGAGTTKPF